MYSSLVKASNKLCLFQQLFMRNQKLKHKDKELNNSNNSNNNNSNSSNNNLDPKQVFKIITEEIYQIYQQVAVPLNPFNNKNQLKISLQISNQFLFSNFSSSKPSSSHNKISNSLYSNSQYKCKRKKEKIFLVNLIKSCKI